MVARTVLGMTTEESHGRVTAHQLDAGVLIFTPDSARLWLRRPQFPESGG